jgi:hypothetical protein
MIVEYCIKRHYMVHSIINTLRRLCRREQRDVRKPRKGSNHSRRSNQLLHLWSNVILEKIFIPRVHDSQAEKAGHQQILQPFAHQTVAPLPLIAHSFSLIEDLLDSRFSELDVGFCGSCYGCLFCCRICWYY